MKPSNSDRASLPSGDPEIATDLNMLGLLLTEQSRFAEAEPLYREALRLRRAALPAGHLDIAAGLNDLGELLRQEGQLDEAEAVYRESLQIFRASLPADHPTIARSLNNLAMLLRADSAAAGGRAALPRVAPDFARITAEGSSGPCHQHEQHCAALACAEQAGRGRTIHARMLEITLRTPRITRISQLH